MSNVDLIINAVERREKALSERNARIKAQEEAGPAWLNPSYLLRLVLCGFSMFLAGMVILSQPQVQSWLQTVFASG